MVKLEQFFLSNVALYINALDSLYNFVEINHKCKNSLQTLHINPYVKFDGYPLLNRSVYFSQFQKQFKFYFEFIPNIETVQCSHSMLGARLKDCGVIDKVKKIRVVDDAFNKFHLKTSNDIYTNKRVWSKIECVDLTKFSGVVYQDKSTLKSLVTVRCTTLRPEILSKNANFLFSPQIHKIVFYDVVFINFFDDLKRYVDLRVSLGGNPSDICLIIPNSIFRITMNTQFLEKIEYFRNLGVVICDLGENCDEIFSVLDEKIKKRVFIYGKYISEYHRFDQFNYWEDDLDVKSDKEMCLNFLKEEKQENNFFEDFKKRNLEMVERCASKTTYLKSNLSGLMFANYVLHKNVREIFFPQRGMEQMVLKGVANVKLDEFSCNRFELNKCMDVDIYLKNTNFVRIDWGCNIKIQLKSKCDYFLVQHVDGLSIKQDGDFPLLLTQFFECENVKLLNITSHQFICEKCKNLNFKNNCFEVAYFVFCCNLNLSLQQDVSTRNKFKLKLHPKVVFLKLERSCVDGLQNGTKTKITNSDFSQFNNTFIQTHKELLSHFYSAVFVGKNIIKGTVNDPQKLANLPKSLPFVLKIDSFKKGVFEFGETKKVILKVPSGSTFVCENVEIVVWEKPTDKPIRDISTTFIENIKTLDIHKIDKKIKSCHKYEEPEDETKPKHCKFCTTDDYCWLNVVDDSSEEKSLLKNTKINFDKLPSKGITIIGKVAHRVALFKNYTKPSFKIEKGNFDTTIVVCDLDNMKSNDFSNIQTEEVILRKSKNNVMLKFFDVDLESRVYCPYNPNYKMPRPGFYTNYPQTKFMRLPNPPFYAKKYDFSEVKLSKVTKRLKSGDLKIEKVNRLREIATDGQRTISGNYMVGRNCSNVSWALCSKIVCLKTVEKLVVINCNNLTKVVLSPNTKYVHLQNCQNLVEIEGATQKTKIGEKPATIFFFFFEKLMNEKKVQSMFWRYLRMFLYLKYNIKTIVSKKTHIFLLCF
ncbi:hypothetical protein EIN_301700 [Entamoeba invadens IP1]|uniref:Uncharacterized protein n=1 Tax=Entamoeba invadens IP1 TaxID=370355 RepID=A0A0A1UA00_ENTIV|nr:hypothetical protein EIN_301700 [Entamoeba invadens IP1]ELP89971.1 hypothetical protein EIN_301700 [Entamoeba invadens IP1]|eukprot:XP_004256742.1 hypothetical protein EIN_301700 [Entamoeba invadens IP1]